MFDSGTEKLNTEPLLFQEALNNYTNYPLLRYMGSKHKLLSWIKENLSGYKFNTVLDAFSGSGAVSYLFKTLNKSVTSNDFLHFSYILSKATVENNFEKVNKEEIEKLISISKEAPNFIQHTFKNIFYSASDLKFLDSISYNIKNLKSEYKKALTLSALIRACVKKQPRGVFTISSSTDKYNDGRRDLKLTIKDHFLEQIEIFNNLVFNNQQTNKALNLDVFDSEISKHSYDLVYLDPPYVPKADDNCYVKRYHFLEGLSKYWEGYEIIESSKVKKIKKKYTPFSYRKTAIEAFENLFKQYADSIIMLSYSSNGYPDLATLKKILKKYKSSVRVQKIPHRYHFGNHANVNRSLVEEYLIIGR
ncbi:DNA adenine methylase [Leptospira licerasiae]|uniref:DNA adenine methylase n=1 Tax=Leptospira licerasiae TaxID=447106 RepID=UPI003017194E